MAPWRTSRAGEVGVSGTPEELARDGYAKHGGELYGYALSRLSDDGAAQDAVQETVIRAWRSGALYDPARATLRTWLFAIHRNVVTDQLVARRRTASVAAATAQMAETGEDHVNDHAATVADADLVARALGLISDDHRIAIVETYLRDRPYDEVATELGVSVSTLRSRVFHGLRHLRRTMKTMVIDP